VEETPPEVRPPCAVCGETARTTFATVNIAITLQTHLKTRFLYRDGGRKPVRILTEGDDFTRKTGRWSKVYWLIDRGNNRYTKTYRDSETGEIIYQADEPLTEHRHRPKPTQSD
jgi:hypothetical protein